MVNVESVDELLTVQEAMSRLKVSDETIYRWIRAKQLRAIRTGNLWRIPASSIIEFLAKGEQK